MEKLKSVWHNDNYPQYQKLDHDIDVNTAIIGGGLSGISAAYYLSRHGISTAVLEANKIGSGTTKNTTAHITSQHDMTYDRYTRQFGQVKASIIAKANQEAIDEIENIIKTEKIDCNFERVDSFLFTQRPENCIKLRQEYKAVQNTPIKAFLTTQTGLIPLEYELALGFENQAMFHPMKYLHGLAQAATNHKVKIYEDTRVIDVQNNYCLTEDGRKITAQNFVIATNFPIINFKGLYFARIIQHRSYNGAYKTTKSLSGMWNNIDSEAYTYRKFEDMVIVSGQSHQCGHDMDTPHYKNWQNHVNKIFEDNQAVAKWSAQDSLSPDNLALVGNLTKNEKHLYIMTGFNKWGMTSTNIAGRIIADLIAGQKNPYAEIYSPSRKLAMGPIGKTLWNNIKMVGSLIGGINYLGNPACTHMGCRTKFNPEEQTWDCPCHGSRFDKFGNVINTPAYKKLDDKKVNPDNSAN
ncbi:MAG: FAD-dependent oxidoreductase [Clostridiales bacterium]|nr:FAD-dependent oxidoreductase [Clostridiales bacterium]